MSRERAQAKIDEWFVGVTEQAFRAAVELKLAVGVAEGDYRFRAPDERLQVQDGAMRFFREFAAKVIELSDGRCVYFAPDIRARSRGIDNAMAWAEYAIHAVTSSGRRIAGKDYWERLFNPTKLESLDVIEQIIRREDCFAKVNDGHPERDCIIFVGTARDGGRVDGREAHEPHRAGLRVCRAEEEPPGRRERGVRRAPDGRRGRQVQRRVIGRRMTVASHDKRNPGSKGPGFRLPFFEGDMVEYARERNVFQI